MILNDKQKNFIIKNREALQSLFLSRIEEMKEEMVNEDNEEKTKAVKLLIREFKIWLKDIDMIANPPTPKKQNLI